MFCFIIFFTSHFFSPYLLTPVPSFLPSFPFPLLPYSPHVFSFSSISHSSPFPSLHSLLPYSPPFPSFSSTPSLSSLSFPSMFYFPHLHSFSSPSYSPLSPSLPSPILLTSLLFPPISMSPSFPFIFFPYLSNSPSFPFLSSLLPFSSVLSSQAILTPLPPPHPPIFLPFPSFSYSPYTLLLLSLTLLTSPDFPSFHHRISGKVY